MEDLPLRRKLIIMISILSALFFTSVNMTIIATALPKVIAAIGGMNYYDLVFTSYMLTTTVTSLITGKLSDIYGRKTFLLIGIAIFTVGSFLCGLSLSIYQLIIYRAIQGVGGGMVLSSSFATVGELFSPRERGRWQGLLSTMFGFSNILGPTLGGYITDYFTWPWIFWVFLPLGVLAFSFIIKLYPPRSTKQAVKIDYGGAVTISILITSLLLAFSWGGQTYAWLSWPIISLFTISLISFIFFIRIESKAENPVLPLFLFKNKTFSVAMLGGATLGIGFYCMNIYMPMFIQGVMGRSATISGLTLIAMTISLMIASVTAGQFMSRTGKYKIIALIGFSAGAIGLFLHSFLQPHSSLVRVALQLAIIGFGFGSLMTVLQISVQNAVKYKYLGVATASMQVFRQLWGTIGVAVMGTMVTKMTQSKISTMPFDGEFDDHFREELLNPQILMDTARLDELTGEISGGLSMFQQMIDSLRTALSSSLTMTFLMISCLFVITLVMTAMVKELPLRTSNKKDPIDPENEPAYPEMAASKE